jgi:pyrroloquinoline quinone biosynthesis protein B
LFNAAPDLRQRIFDNDILHQSGALRASPIEATVLTNADVDHVAGLLNLRESQAFNLYGTPRVLSVLEANSIFNVLNPKFVFRQAIELDRSLRLETADGSSLGITIVPFAIPGKVALWLENEAAGDNFGTVDEDTIALEVRDEKGITKFFYLPACARMTAALAARIHGAGLVFFDGTLWVDDEMVRDKVGIKTGKRMGHMSVFGREGMLAALRDLEIRRKIFISINTTNPILIKGTPERKAVEAEGWEVSFDGMAIEL